MSGHSVPSFRKYIYLLNLVMQNFYYTLRWFWKVSSEQLQFKNIFKTENKFPK